MKVVIVLTLAAAVSGQYPTPAPAPSSGHRGLSAAAPKAPQQYRQAGPTQYQYQWAVNEEGNQFQHRENRQDSSAEGSYSVALPDGRVQTVTYTVNGDGGYVAEVTYEGEAQFPAAKPSQDQARQPVSGAQRGYTARSAPQASYVSRPAAKTPTAAAGYPGVQRSSSSGRYQSSARRPAAAPAAAAGGRSQHGRQLSPPAAYGAPVTAAKPSSAYPAYKTASAPSEEYGAPQASYPAYKTAAAPSEEYGAPQASYPAYKTSN